MFGTINCLCPQEKMEGTLLTREQVEEISTRISKSVSENVSKQLKNAISLATPTEKKKKKKNGKAQWSYTYLKEQFNSSNVIFSLH